jgi:precorrin-6B methylase 2
MSSWTELLHAVRTGESAFKHVYGEPVFQWALKHPKETAIFQEAMTSISTVAAQAVVNTYDFSKAKTIVDVGGGHGFLLSSVLRANPNARGILFDMPEVVDGAKHTIAGNGLDGRCEIVGGDFFRAVPSGADVYMLKHIIHDWSDEDSTKILSHCAAGLAPNGRVLIIEAVLPPAGVPAFGKIIDLEMLVMTDGGRERTEGEYGALLSRAGLKLSRVIPTQSPVAIVEATK